MTSYNDTQHTHHIESPQTGDILLDFEQVVLIDAVLPKLLLPRVDIPTN
jgi:hypothetical protein